MAFYLIIYVAVFLAAIGQIFLKIGSNREGIQLGIFRINGWIIIGLGSMISSIFLSVRGLSVVPLKDLAFIFPTTYILVPFLSALFLKEKIGKNTIIGTLIMIIGIIVFNIPSIRLLG